MSLKALLDAILQRRRRFAPLVLGLGVLVVGLTVQRATPHETRLRLRLPAQNHVREVEVAYLVADEVAVTSNFRYADHAPTTVDATAELSPGRYTVRVQMTEASTTREVLRTIDVPTEGTLVIDMTETP